MNDTATRIDIVIPARNMADWLGATLDSLKAQSFSQFRAIVIDDGSTDATADIARTAADGDGRFTLVAGTAQGVSAARNLGFETGDAPFVLFLDADDLLYPDALERMVAALDAAPEAVGAMGAVARVTETLQDMPGNDNRLLVPPQDHILRLLEKNFIVNGGGLLLRRDVIDRSGGYDPSLVLGEDWEFWCRVLALGDLALVPGEPVLKWRQRGSRQTQVRISASPLQLTIDCIDRVAADPAIKSRVGPSLRRRLRKRRIDWYWARVRNQAHFGPKWKAGLHAGLGLVIFPDSLAQPQMFLRFLRSVRS